MFFLEDNFKANLKENTFIALGSFDGLHLGHMALINKTLQLAKYNKSKSMICTFKNHPLTVINKDISPKLIMDNNRKVKLLDDLGIDILNMFNFNKEFMNILPEDFVKKLVECYNAKGVIVGFNYRFGFKNLGDIELLKKLSKEYNFKLYVVKPIKCKEGVVSSSKIRIIISEEGDIEKANKMLTRPFMLQGKVIKGKQIGRKIGFPTINLDYNRKFVLPRGGVYFTIVKYNNKKYRGITNIGYNPTVENKKLSVETHILDFKKDIYNENISVYFVKRIRDEKKFNSLEHLSEQLKNDKMFAYKEKI